MINKKKIRLYTKIICIIALFMIFGGCVQNNPPADDVSQLETSDSSSIEDTKITQFEELEQPDLFVQQALEMDLKEFQVPQPTYAPEDPDRPLKDSIDHYLYARNSILADINQPFSAKEALAEMLSYCDTSFRMEAKVTIWYIFYMRKIQNMDLSYEDFRHRTTYLSIEYEGNRATIRVKDSIQFMTAGKNVVSASGDIHVIVAEQVDGKWLIIRDDPGQIEGYINDAFHKFRSECPYSDEKEIETYIMDRFATWGNDPLPPYTITG